MQMRLIVERGQMGVPGLIGRFILKVREIQCRAANSPNYLEVRVPVLPINIELATIPAKHMDMLGLHFMDRHGFQIIQLWLGIKSTIMPLRFINYSI